MTNALRTLVSQNRVRFVDEAARLNLDLAYITDRVIAMGYPAQAQSVEVLFRNSASDVKRMLDANHPGCYKVYNLCSDRSPRSKYPASVFDGRMTLYSMPDHSPPKFSVIMRFCQDVANWLSQSPDNVAVIHCKAGKGRTGTMISCYLVFSGQCADADAAMALFGDARTKDGRGVTIPSQKRYVRYFDALLKDNLDYKDIPVRMHRVVVSGAKGLASEASQLQLRILQEDRCQQDTIDLQACQVSQGTFVYLPPRHIDLLGDVKIDIMAKRKLSFFRGMKQQVILRSFSFDFHAWFNTFFLKFEKSDDECSEEAQAKLVLCKEDLDDLQTTSGNKRDQFVVALFFQKI